MKRHQFLCVNLKLDGDGLMKIKFILSVVSILILFSSAAMAYDLQLTPEGPYDMNSDSYFDVFVMFNPDQGGSRLGTFGFNLSYDTSELTYNSYQFFYPDPIGPAFTPSFENPAGKINNLSGFLPFGQTAPTISDPYTLAKITFDIADPSALVSDGQADVWFDTGVGTGLTVNDNYVQLSSITLVGTPDIAVAPEPISSILFLTGGAMLGFRRFFKRNSQTC